MPLAGDRGSTLETLLGVGLAEAVARRIARAAEHGSAGRGRRQFACIIIPYMESRRRVKLFSVTSAGGMERAERTARGPARSFTRRSLARPYVQLVPEPRAEILAKKLDHTLNVQHM